MSSLTPTGGAGRPASASAATAQVTRGTNPAVDRFLTDLYDRLHDSPNQARFRQIRPMPFGVVLLPYPGMTEAELRQHFRTMKELGFNAIKQFMATPDWPLDKLRHVGLEEGIIPFWYGEGGWEPFTPELLDQLGIPRDTPAEQIRQHPKMVAHQTEVIRKRIDRHAKQDASPPQPPGQGGPWEGVPHTIGTQLDEQYHPKFVAWLKEQYGTVEKLIDAWNLRAVGIAPRETLPASWDDVAGLLKKVGNNEYRHLRDILRFKADNYLKDIERAMDRHLSADPHEPFRAGGEMGLFLPFASRATDMEGIAKLMDRGGSFYPSIHLAWHFEEVDFEVARCIYMQSSVAADWFKGGWSATWESTGGPQQFSGGKAWDPFAAQKTAGFTVDEGTMTQLLLSYLAGGFKGVGLWCWNTRTAGWEAGEYALLDRNGQVTERARRAGAIAKAANRLRDELWEARKEPLVGVFQDFDAEAIWACNATPNRDKYKFEPIHARTGVHRALINANVPFENVSAADLRAGLAARYAVIYLPAILGLDAALLPILHQYVEQGGRLVIDMPGAWFDTYGKLLPTGKGSAFEKLFGASLDDFQYSNPNTPRAVGDVQTKGFVVDLTPTAARVVASFAGPNQSKTAITEHPLGKGSAVILGYEASLMCYRPGNAAAEKLLVTTALGAALRSPYRSDAIVYRLAAPAADHYFVINDGPTRTTSLSTDYAYARAEDAVTQQPIDLGKFEVEGYSGRWVRCVKA
jgi:beta-galactosidase